MAIAIPQLFDEQRANKREQFAIAQYQRAWYGRIIHAAITPDMAFLKYGSIVDGAIPGRAIPFMVTFDGHVVFSIPTQVFAIGLTVLGPAS
jgi:hypothetical protein